MGKTLFRTNAGKGYKRINDVESCLQTGEIIENYPDDLPHPSCLIFGRTKENKILHIVVGSDSTTLFFITAYFPNTDKFEKDLKTRKGCYKI